LKGYSYYRADVGEYRIVYQVEEQTLEILLIEKRNDDEIYKQLKRKM
jgi:mRNA interferase RelE/StbE